jgi:nicotinamidase-related amidase
MTQNTVRPTLSEKGLLTPQNCVVTMIDLQPQMLFGVSNFDRQSIINNNVALAKAARVFGLPVVLSSVETKGFSGNTWPQLLAALGNPTPIERTTMNAWDDKNFLGAVQKTGRKKLVLAGLWTEICIALPTVQAIHDGYEVFVVEDCCGDVSQLAHDNAMRRVVQAGVRPVTAPGSCWNGNDSAHRAPTTPSWISSRRTRCVRQRLRARLHPGSFPATIFPEYVIPGAPQGNRAKPGEEPCGEEFDSSQVRFRQTGPRRRISFLPTARRDHEPDQPTGVGHRDVWWPDCSGRQ